MPEKREATLRIGIVSLFGLYNYGNRLQGYAVDRILGHMACAPTTIVVRRKLALSLLKDRAAAAYHRHRADTVANKRGRFCDFVGGQAIREIRFPWELRELGAEYDYFVVGSDQIWHPDADVFPRTKFLEFARQHQRIAFAPSFGVNQLPAAAHAEYASGLAGFPVLSTRERSGQELVRMLAGKHATVLADPTLGLSRAEWTAASVYDHVPTNRYAVTYFLGGLEREDWESLQALARKRGLTLVDLMDSKPAIGAHLGPQDFLGLIQAASVVFSDSFHACVFSLIFEVPFVVYPRREAGSSTGSRIETLLETFRLQDRVRGAVSADRVCELDFSEISHIRDGERHKLLNYMETALGRPRRLGDLD